MKQAAPPRPFLVDAGCAVAFFLLAFFLTKATRGLFVLSAFVFVTTAGAGYAFAKSAWRTISGQREKGRIGR